MKVGLCLDCCYHTHINPISWDALLVLQSMAHTNYNSIQWQGRLAALWDLSCFLLLWLWHSCAAWLTRAVSFSQADYTQKLNPPQSAPSCCKVPLSSYQLLLRNIFHDCHCIFFVTYCTPFAICIQLPSDIKENMKCNVVSVHRDTSQGTDMHRKGALYFGHPCPRPSFSLSCFTSAGWPHPRGAARVGEYPPAQGGAAGGHSGNTGIGYRRCCNVYICKNTHGR